MGHVQRLRGLGLGEAASDDQPLDFEHEIGSDAQMFGFGRRKAHTPFFIPAEFVRDDSTRCAEMMTPPPLARAMFVRAE